MLAVIIKEITKEAMASAIYHWNSSINTKEVMTPTLPSVSAAMCKKTPIID